MILYGLFLSVVGVIGTLLFLDFLYQCAIALSYVRKANPLPRADARLRFAVLVPAHNEESVIVPLLESLKAQTYPPDFVDIYVSCDDCTDATASLARERGAKVLIRHDPGRRGKTWNVRWALAHIPLDSADAVAVFDADNLAAPDFLSKMNDFLAAHPEAKAVQGYLDVKNPTDSWVSRAYAVGYWFTNRFWQAARDHLGLSCALGGTGLVIRTATFLKLTERIESLTEDLEMTAMLVLAGERVYWNEHSVVYDEKPVSLRPSMRQRLRWMQGHYWVLGKYGPKALRLFLTTRRLRYLDLVLYLLVPLKLCLSIAVLGVAIWEEWLPGTLMTLPGLATLVSFPIVYTMTASILGPSIRNGRPDFSYLRYFPTFLFYGITWLPLVFHALFLAHNQGNWVATRHNRDIVIGEIAKVPASRQDG